MKARGDAKDARLSMHGAGMRVDVSLVDGTLALTDAAGWRVTSAAGVEVELGDGRVLSPDGWRVEEPSARFEDVHGAGVSATLVSGDDLRLRLDVAVYDRHPFVLLHLGVENNALTSVRLRRIVPLAARAARGGGLAPPAPGARWRCFRHGWQSWTPSLSLAPSQRDIDARPPVHAPAPPPAGRGTFASEDVAAIGDERSGRGLLAGFVSARRFVTQVHIDLRRRALEAMSVADGIALAPGETAWSERLLVDAFDDASRAFGRYADALAREQDARVPDSVPSGWCSWYHYFTEVTEQDVLANLRALKEQRRALPFEYIQIDDGYQAEIGDWSETNETFPSGMAAIAKEITSAGYRAGIWLAPFLAGERSQLFARHPDWLVRDDDGEPVLALRNWGQRCYALDCTHPEADRWLRELFTRIVDEWGYDYVKIDFLYAGAVAGRRHDANATRIEAYRRGLGAIRESVGDRFVLGCGALMAASVGLVDGQRIGPDVAPWWRFNRPLDPPRERGRPNVGGEPSAENALRNTFTRAWMHNRLWANDPDCLLARDTRTKLTLPEVQSFATAIALSGGMVLQSDDMTALSRERIDIVSLLLPPLGRAPGVPGLLTESMPSELRVEMPARDGPWWLAGAFNWQRRRRALTVGLPPGRWHAFELWQRSYLGRHAGRLTLDAVPAHGAALLALRPVLERPQLVGSTFHASMGGREVEREVYDRRRHALRLRLTPVAQKDGELFICAPNGYRFAEAKLNGRSLPPAHRERNLLVFSFRLDAPSGLAVRFQPPA